MPFGPRQMAVQTGPFGLYAVYSLGLLVAAKIAGRGKRSARLPFPRAYPGGLDVALCRKSQRKVGRFHKMTRLTPEPARLPCTRRCGRRRTPPRQYCLYSTAKEGSQVVTVPPASLGDTPAICPLQAYRYWGERLQTRFAHCRWPVTWPASSDPEPGGPAQPHALSGCDNWEWSGLQLLNGRSVARSLTGREALA